MNAFSDELRLAWVALLNVGLFVVAYRFARRYGAGGALQAVCDAFLIYFLAQYAAVALPGLCGMLSGLSMSLVAVAIAAALNHLARVNQPSTSQCARPKRNDAFAGVSDAPGRDRADRFAFTACALFVAAYLISYAFVQRYMPPIATDALVYHLPTAVQWLQTGHLGIYPTWYWNPAASYSPATASMFMAWWIAPAGNDVFVRFVQLPPLLFIFFLVARMARLMGCTRAVAGLVAVAATLSRPFISEAIVQKDDLYVTAFIAAAVLSLSREAIRDRLGPWRVGIAIGFVLASKYTALLACPVFLFLIDSPFRARWKTRHYLFALLPVLAMVLPWYLRNILLKHNPLYPVDVHFAGLRLPGLFSVERDQQLHTLPGVWRMFAQTYHSLPLAVIITLALAWTWCMIRAPRFILRDPLARACAIGSIVTLFVFLITSPHHEVRYIFPLVVLWFAAAGLAISKGITRWQIPAAVLLAAVSLFTSFASNSLAQIVTLAGIALLVSLAGVGAIFLIRHVLCLQGKHIAMLTSAATAAIAMVVYVQWHAYVQGYHDGRTTAWAYPSSYPRQAPAWKWVDENTPPHATLAYANTFFVYPWYGFNFTHRVGYAPVRNDLHDLSHFPRMGDAIPGDLIVKRMTQVMDEDVSGETWLENLRALGADYLIIAKHDPDLDTHPPELRLARENPTRFIVVYEDVETIVFRISLK